MARRSERRRRRRRMPAHRPESRAAGSPESRRRSRSPHRQSGGSACRRIALPTVAPGLPSGHRPDAMPLRRPSSPRRPSESRGAFFPACAKGSTFSIVGRIDPRPRGRCMGFLVNPGCPILAERTGRMDQDLEELVARASDPRWIPAIYNYCDRRCARCRFSDRCFAFNEEAREGNAPEDIVDVVSGSLDRTLRLVRAYAEREAIDLDAITETATTEEVSSRDAVYGGPARRRGARIRNREWQTAGRARNAARDPGEGRRPRTRCDSLQWLSTMIAPKICRALTGLIDPSVAGGASHAKRRTRVSEDCAADDRRVACRMACASTKFGRAPTRFADAGLARRCSNASTRSSAERIPRAMEFVRPGFDEPAPGTFGRGA